MAVALLLCAVLVDRLWRLRHLAQSSDPGDEEVREAASRGPAGLRESVQQIAASPYLTAIAALILASSFVTAVAAWQFKAIAVAVDQRQERADGVLRQLHASTRACCRWRCSGC